MPCKLLQEASQPRKVFSSLHTNNRALQLFSYFQVRKSFPTLYPNRNTILHSLPHGGMADPLTVLGALSASSQLAQQGISVITFICESYGNYKNPAFTTEQVEQLRQVSWD